MNAIKDLYNCTLLDVSNSCLQVQICQSVLQYHQVMRIPDHAIHINHIPSILNENPPQNPWYLWVFKGKQNKYCWWKRNKKWKKSGRSSWHFTFKSVCLHPTTSALNIIKVTSGYHVAPVIRQCESRQFAC